MASNAPQASQAWHNALKLRKHLLKQLEKLRAEGASGTEISHFEAVDGLLEKFRLACVQTIFIDFEYAVKENTEEALWGLHISINSEYRKTLGTLKHSSQPVERRKTEKMYNNFLRIAQKFYKGYIQRLSARYDVQELKRVAHGIEVELMDAGDSISPVPEELSRQVLKSCHSTLIHLGDLARYRVQAKHKNAGFETTLTYYGLARHLMPNAGFAFHQMGIVNLDQANHLDVVYHFYRAWAVETPHPNAKSNLEAEFKSLRLPNAVRARNSTSAPGDVFSTWFVKLHAFFYTGEKFSQQKELEEEVMYRLEMACRDATSSKTLLKMALVNMSAFDIATNTFTEAKAETGSRFWHFTLRFNAMFLRTFCRILHAELEEALSNASEEPASQPIQITSTVGGLLPTLRVYCVWLAAHRQELTRASEALGGIITDMMQNLVKVFTLLCASTYNQENLESCPYLLPEDLEIRGNRPLIGDQVPKACRVHCDENGAMKPHLYNTILRFEEKKENMARVLDVLRCAYFLAEDDSTPISCQVVDNWLVFNYCPDATRAPLPDDTIKAPVPIEKASLNVAEKAVESHSAQEPVNVGQQQALGQTDRGSDKPDIQKQRMRIDPPHRTDTADNDQTEQTVISMLTPFLKPPTPSPKHHVRSPGAASSVSQTSPFNAMFGSAQSFTSPTGSTFSVPIAPFPWAWDNTPKPSDAPDAAASAGKEAFDRASRDNSPRDSVASGNPLEDPFATPGKDALQTYAPQYAEPQTGGHPLRLSGIGSETAHRDRLLQSFARNVATSNSSPLTTCDEAGLRSSGRNGIVASPLTHPPQGPNTMLTGSSGFSHPSSLYISTPANVVGLGVSGHGHFGNNHPLSPTFAARASSARRSQTGSSAMSYNEAVLRAAWADK
ncbi:hypothetical protein HIM_01752 [Hirsutella minnesotensis 3608]|nr:hypothetical protein HIM_01752 [Hirsutella minnesotensis 3608]